MRTTPLAALALAALLALPALATASHATAPEAAQALAYLRGLQRADGSLGTGATADVASSAWAALAFARAGIDPGTVTAGGASLEAFVVASTLPVDPQQVGRSLLDLERQVLALSASGAPLDAPGFDTVQALRATFDGTQLGDCSLLNDDIFGLLALDAAGVPDSDPLVQAVRSFVLGNQQPQGAFAYGALTACNPANLVFALAFADTDTTAAAIQALLATGSAPTDLPVVRALEFLRTNQNVDGGCGAGLLDRVLSAATSNADSTGWTLMALRALGEDPEGPGWTTVSGATPLGFLRSLQRPDGHVQWQPGVESFLGASTTAWAALAFAGHGFAG